MNNTKEKGAVALFITIIILGVGLAIAGSLVFVFLNRLQAAENVALSEQAYFTAEAGIEDVLYRVIKGEAETPDSYPYVIELGGGEAEVNFEEDGDMMIITSRGNVLDRQRELETIIRRTSDGVAFHYGAQVGAGGLVMGNSATLEGSVYSNGGINMNNPGTMITGDAFVAGNNTINKRLNSVIGGNARAYNITASGGSGGGIEGNALATNIIDGPNIEGNAHAGTLINCNVGGNVIYQVLNDCAFAGSEEQDDPPEPLEPEPLPISDETIENWRSQAEESGNVGDCGGGVYEPEDGSVLGPGVLNCDLSISNQNTVYIGGYLWVKGNIDIDTHSKALLHPSFGSTSSVIIAYNPDDIINSGRVTVRSQAEVLGTDHDDSFLMVVSENRGVYEGQDITAIELRNLSHADIFYARRGRVHVRQDTSVWQVVGYEVVMGQSMTLTYQTGLANVEFSAGPGGGYSILSWQEL